MKKIIVLGALLSGAAFAGNGQRNDPPAPSAQQELSFEQLKAACQNPANFHNQIAPSNIQISCGDVQYKWVPSTEGTISMPTARYVATSIISDKYTVGTTQAQVASTAQVASCPRFKQISETVDFVRSVSCAEVVAYPGTGTDFCVGAINDLRASNPAAVTLAETGKYVDFCGGSSATLPAPGKDRGQR